MLLQNAKNNRKHMTEAESVLWQCLRGSQLGCQFRRQHPIFGYIPDFVCLKKRLVVEVDGRYHHIGNQPLSDEERTNFLNQYGFEVIRFTNEEVLSNIDDVITAIKRVMNNKSTICTNHEPVSSMLSGDRGRVVIFSAPSGSGKSTIVNWLMQEHPELKLYFSISCTSRAPRGTEQNGVEYFFISPEEFRDRIAKNEFLEYEEVYHDRFYGTLKQQVERQREQGQNVVFDVDVKGGVNIKKHYGDEALSLFIQPPSVAELRKRLEGRGTDSAEAIEERLAKAEYEMTFASQFDHVIVNDDLQAAKQETLSVVMDFLNQKE